MTGTERGHTHSSEFEKVQRNSQVDRTTSECSMFEDRLTTTRVLIIQWYSLRDVQSHDLKLEDPTVCYADREKISTCYDG